MDNSRERFEAWYKENMGCLIKWDRGDSKWSTERYVGEENRIRFKVWQAAQNDANKEIQRLKALLAEKDKV